MIGGPAGQYGQMGGYGMELGKAAAAAGYAAERLRPEEAQRSYLLHQQAHFFTALGSPCCAHLRPCWLPQQRHDFLSQSCMCLAVHYCGTMAHGSAVRRNGPICG